MKEQRTETVPWCIAPKLENVFLPDIICSYGQYIQSQSVLHIIDNYMHV